MKFVLRGTSKAMGERGVTWESKTLIDLEYIWKLMLNRLSLLDWEFKETMLDNKRIDEIDSFIYQVVSSVGKVDMVKILKVE